MLLHDLACALDGARHAGLANEHMMCFFGQHEAAGTRQRIETRFCQCAQLKFAVTVGEVGKHVERQPVRRFFIEGFKNARIVLIAGITVQQCFGFLATIAAKIFMQQVNHRPQMTALFHIHLEQIAQVVLRRAGQAEMTLLLD